MAELQEAKDELDSLEEELVGAKTREYSGVMEMGDALRDHLTQDEQSAVKNDLNRLRSDWKTLEEKVASVSASLDASLQQFAEFTCLQVCAQQSVISFCHLWVFLTQILFMDLARNPRFDNVTRRPGYPRRPSGFCAAF